MKRRRKLIAKMKENHTCMYVYIYGRLSAKSKDEVKHDADYKRINDEIDLLGLWKTIKKVHQTTAISKCAAVIKRVAYKEVSGIRQGTFESIIDFRI